MVNIPDMALEVIPDVKLRFHSIPHFFVRISAARTLEASISVTLRRDDPDTRNNSTGLTNICQAKCCRTVTLRLIQARSCPSARAPCFMLHRQNEYHKEIPELGASPIGTSILACVVECFSPSAGPRAHSPKDARLLIQPLSSECHSRGIFQWSGLKRNLKGRGMLSTRTRRALQFCFGLRPRRRRLANQLLLLSRGLLLYPPSTDFIHCK